MKKNERAFDWFGPKERMEYLESLNAEIPVDKVHLKLTDEEKKGYMEDLEDLKKDRKRVPGISYEVKYTWLE